MGIKRRNKTSAEFSMSSLTDIIFLLLIFFMLTSSLVQINIQLPESDSKTVAPTDLAVMIKKDGTLTVNGKLTAKRDLSKRIARQKTSAGEATGCLRVDDRTLGDTPIHRQTQSFSTSFHGEVD